VKGIRRVQGVVVWRIEQQPNSNRSSNRRSLMLYINSTIGLTGGRAPGRDQRYEVTGHDVAL
jgi:hypothetical protein